MQLKGKILIVLVSVILTLALAYYLVFRNVILQSFIDLDKAEAEKNMYRCTAALNREVKLLGRFVHDWASWDDTYQFVQGGNPTFVRSNITTDVFNAQKLNLIYIYNLQGKLMAGKAFDIVSGREIPLDLSRELKPGVFASLINQRDEKKSLSGIIQTRYGPMMISSNPILTSDETGPSRGAIIMGRFLNRDFFTLISEQVDVRLDAYPAGSGAIGEIEKYVFRPDSGKVVIQEDSGGTHSVFFPMEDLGGDPALVLKASVPCDILRKGKRAYFYGFMFILGSGILLLTVVGRVIRFLVLSPISRLTDNMLSVGRGEALGMDELACRKDELGTLSREFRSMVESLAERERKLWLSERRLRQIIDLVPHFIFAKDEDGRYILANKAVADVFGCPIKDMIGKHDTDLALSGEEVEKFRSQDNEVLGKGKTVIVEESITDSQGSVRFLHTTKMPFAFSETSEPAVLGVSVDITDIKNVERALKESESRLSNLIDFLPDPTFALDMDGRVIVWNRAIEVMTGIPKEDILGKGNHAHAFPFYGEARPVLADLMLSPDKEMHRRYSFVSEVDGKFLVEAFAPNLYGKKGAYLWATAAKLHDSTGTVIGSIECIRDVTERKEREDLLVRQSAIIEQSHDGIMVTDFDGRILYANPSWEIMHGYAPGEVKNAGHARIFHSEKQLREEVLPLIEQVRNHGGTTMRIGHRRKDGKEFTTLMTSFLLKDQKGNPAATISIARDISAEIRMEDQLRQSQKMDVIGQLAGGVAHDLNNMLAPILGYAEMLLQAHGEEDSDYNALLQILTSADRARRLTRQLLAFGSKQVLDIRTVSLNEAIDSYYRMIRRSIREDIDIRIAECEETATVRIDIAQMGQILLNLALNAQDAISGSGTITIETSELYLDDSYTASHQGVEPGEYVMLSFSDTGSGMDREIIEHIFEPFFTTKERGKGTGLGLATVYGIVTQHHGHIMVYSEPGMGTAFKIYLPRATGEIEKVAGAPTVDKGKRGKETIAVAEDDEGVRTLVCEILKGHGYTVITAPNTEEFIRAVEQHSGSIDLMLSDVIMPVLNGKQLYQRVHPGHPEMKVVYMSGYTDNVIAHHGILDRDVRFIQKPFSVRALTDVVRSVLDES